MSKHMGPPVGMPMNKGEKHSFAETWGKLLGFCKPYIFAIIVALIFAVGGTIFTIIGPDRLSDMTDIITDGIKGEFMSAAVSGELPPEMLEQFSSGEQLGEYVSEGMTALPTAEDFQGIDLNKILEIGFVLLVMYASSAVLSYSQGFIMTTVTQKITYKLRTAISKKINRLPLRYFDSNSTGDLLSRVTNDVDTIGQTLNQSVASLISAITLFGGSLFMMFKTNWLLALVAIGSSLFGFVFMSLVITRSQKYFREQQEELGSINGHIEEIYSGHNVVKAYNGERAAKKTFEEINGKLYKCGWKSQFVSGIMMPFMGFIGNLGYVAVCVVGAVLVKESALTFGAIVAFIIYVRLFTQPLSQFAQAATTLQSTAAASKRIFDFLGEKELSDESETVKRLETARGDIEFKDVRFGYSPDKIIINDFSAKASAGQKIAIVGPTGAGKTTMVNLLMRFYEVNSGEITIDGVPISQMTRENIHSLFCMVLQDTWLFEGTIRENIAYSKKDVTDEEIIRACKAVGVHHFIKTLPDGYNTVLSENANLSAGQRQLITIARAMVENAPLLILDEATSSVDTRTELIIQRAMDKLTEGKTSFIIAHRLSTIKNADLILVMKDGDIIESGNHNELMEKGGFYAELYNSQFEKAS